MSTCRSERIPGCTPRSSPRALRLRDRSRVIAQRHSGERPPGGAAGARGRRRPDLRVGPGAGIRPRGGGVLPGRGAAGRPSRRSPPRPGLGKSREQVLGLTRRPPRPGITDCEERRSAHLRCRRGSRDEPPGHRTANEVVSRRSARALRATAPLGENSSSARPNNPGTGPTRRSGRRLPRAPARHQRRSPECRCADNPRSVT